MEATQVHSGQKQLYGTNALVTARKETEGLYTRAEVVAVSCSGIPSPCVSQCCCFSACLMESVQHKRSMRGPRVCPHSWRGPVSGGV
ncbi:hypothetical protein COCSUDRAFT_34447 [Coccomyxa subellipsoidea C-169]|uniref:Uncharacterized protein n=1 Tax=Coccomyxa subellipsoidea (strain C-169) TaxID=574566 RepID=I0YKT3_COCSC|nr:hypothetical protein COCSUDRAFT_34447 [Coccomyxa subellipsoidea C-169]EIE19002.1 hypothetical protein COCSUDRAFT_34447 [Coccomyxa subellipsoidea C-169]|eukprot:XP_005643546.1 hypothetical protein COCSUDRAFT_34447 [Coccomyxa subellipsoidea C-169]